MNSEKDSIYTIGNASVLDDAHEIPAYLLQNNTSVPMHYSCSFCGVGDSGELHTQCEDDDLPKQKLAPGVGVIRTLYHGETTQFESSLNENGQLEVVTNVPLCSLGGLIRGELIIEGNCTPFKAKESNRKYSPLGTLQIQLFTLFQSAKKVTAMRIKNTVPTHGCLKLKLSLMRQDSAFPIHIYPSVRDTLHKKRKAVTYQQSITKFADLVLAHRGEKRNILIYACGQIDYFAIFAIQEVFRLLGVRNLTGNAEHCLNAGAVHNEILTGQEGPFLTIDQGITGPNRFYLFNGWNGFITHPPVFSEITKRKDFNGYLIEVMETESAKVIEQKLSSDQVLLIKPRTDPHLALAVAHEILSEHPFAIESRFIDHFSDIESFEKYKSLALSSRFKPETVAKRIAAEEKYIERIHRAIKDIAARFCDHESVPINIPSVGLSQTSGVVAHCLWGCALAMIGKYGLNNKGKPLGGTIRLPGQINAESEVQGMSRKYFMGRILMANAADAALRMGLPENAYQAVIDDTPRAALDYSDPTPGEKELFICFGTQFEANMMERNRWIRKLQDNDTTLVVIDPIPDPYSIEHADLIIPSPPHPATSKVYQNGEWKLSISMPNKLPAKETRSDATIIYDLMAEITQRLEADPALAIKHVDLNQHVQSGYLRKRFVKPSPTNTNNPPITPAAQQKTTKKKVTIGRLGNNDIMLNEKKISRKHAELTMLDHDHMRFRIKDLNSVNGVYKNEQQVDDVEFGLEDTIKLSSYILTPELYLPAFNLSMADKNGQDNLSQKHLDGLKRIDGEVCRTQLWERIIDYMSGGCGPLYCRPEHSDGTPITWQELLKKGSLIYGGVGTTRYVLDYSQPDKLPFADIYRQPRKFKFFCPTDQDLSFPSGIILNSGRSPLFDDREKIHFAISSFNSGKATPIVNMPDINPLHISPQLAKKYKLKTGDQVRISGRYSDGTLSIPVNVTERVKGDTVYTSFHKSKAQIERNHYINVVTSHDGRCPYCSQTQVKASPILLEKIGEPTLSKQSMDSTLLALKTSEALHRPGQTAKISINAFTGDDDLPVWSGQSTPLYISEIIQETHDVYTFRLQGNPLCRFVYWPGQFCTLILNIEGKKVLRSYTISSTPSRPHILEITIKRVPGGLVSNWLPDHIQVGDRLTVAGPKGKFYLDPNNVPEKVLFISGGSGVTPMMAMSRWIYDVSANTDIAFLNSVRSPSDIIFGQEIELLSNRYSKFSPIVIASAQQNFQGSGWTGLTGRVTQQIIESLIPDFHDRRIYLCGPSGYMDYIKGVLKKLKFDQSKLHMESFGGVRTSIKNKLIPEPTKPNAISSIPVTETTPVQSAGNQYKITFLRSDKIITTNGHLPLLDLAEEQDIDLDYSCRSGSCGECKVKVLKGQVEMESEEGLEEHDKAAGYVLSCVAIPKSNCVINE